MTQVYTSQNLNTLLASLNSQTLVELYLSKDAYEQSLLNQKAAVICNNIPYIIIPQFITAINSTNLTVDAKTNIMNNINNISGSRLNTVNCNVITTKQQLENAFNPKSMISNHQVSYNNPQVSYNNPQVSYNNPQVSYNNEYVIIMNTQTFLNLIQSKRLNL
jgi:hypothetical protein